MVKWPGIDVDEAAHHRAASQIVLTRPGSAPVRMGLVSRPRAVVGANYSFVVRCSSPEVDFDRGVLKSGVSVEKMRLSGWYVNASATILVDN